MIVAALVVLAYAVMLHLFVVGAAKRLRNPRA